MSDGGDSAANQIKLVVDMMYKMDSRLSSYGREMDAHDTEIKRSIDALTNSITMLSSRLDRLEAPKTPRSWTPASSTPRERERSTRSSINGARPAKQPAYTGGVKPASKSSSLNTARAMKPSHSTSSLGAAGKTSTSFKSTQGGATSRPSIDGNGAPPRGKAAKKPSMSIGGVAGRNGASGAMKTQPRALLSSRRRPITAAT